LLEENAKLKADLTSIEMKAKAEMKFLCKTAKPQQRAAAAVDLPGEAEMS
jgi:hypothetical protein